MSNYSHAGGKITCLSLNVYFNNSTVRSPGLPSLNDIINNYQFLQTCFTSQLSIISPPFHGNVTVLYFSTLLHISPIFYIYNPFSVSPPLRFIYFYISGLLPKTVLHALSLIPHLFSISTIPYHYILLPSRCGPETSTLV